MEQSKGEITAEQVERARPAEDSPERLRERREALGLSVAEMADRIRERTEVTP